MKKILFILFLFAFSGIRFANASHNRAGEITFRHLSGLEYEIKIVTYTKKSSADPPNNVDRPQLDSVHMGDGTIMTFFRDTLTDIGGDINRCVYIETHTYPGSGRYIIYFIDPNRNANVINFPNSFFTPFACYTILNIQGQTQPDNSPVLLNPPIDSGCVGIPFLHNPAAFDPDHDSLSYELIHCHGENNEPIIGYSYPYATNSFTLDPVTGDLLWDSPNEAGEYNVAFLIIEWRDIYHNGIYYRIGEVERDMQIRIITGCSTNSHAPKIENIADTCILAGESLSFHVTATDEDYSGYTFAASSGTFTPLVGGTAATLSTGDLNDGTYAPISLPFSFGFERNFFNQVTPSTNGTIFLGGGGSADSVNRLTSNTPRPFLAPLSDNLDATDATVTYSIVGSVGSRIFTFEWLNMKWFHSVSGPTISFQCKLYEGANKIEFIYRQEAGPLSGDESASIGLAGVTLGDYWSLTSSGASPFASISFETKTINARPANDQVYSFSPHNDFVVLTSSGGPYVVNNPAHFIPPPDNGQNDTVTGTFDWNTNCSNIARQPYQVTFKANDLNSTISLVTYKSVMITVIAPPVTGLTVDPNGNTMMLHWNPNLCANVVHYNIYHRIGSYPGIIECPCQTGVPAYTGYTLIGTTNGLNDTTFIDNNNGAGLAIGISHCYMVTAVFADGSESCASIQVCNQLKKDLPVITNVTVVTTDPSAGSDTIAWSKATEIDTNIFHHPYQYKVYRSDGDFYGTSFHPIATMPVGEDDTIYFDNNLNTTVKNSYKIELYYDSNGDGVPDALKGNTQTASSVFLSLAPTDERIILSWEEHVPWTNTRYDIFKQNGLTWDSIGTTSQHTYTDDSLVNGTQYCYYVRSVGSYGTPGIVDPIINLSQRTCAVAVDNVAPCPPPLTVLSDCIESVNFLRWTNPNNYCADDVLHYNIYFSADGVNYEVIDNQHGATDTTFIHRNLPSLAGCYKVSAVDSVGNESTATAVCVDTCREYVLPSVFTPNGDHSNDFYHPCDSTTSVELQTKNCPPYKNVKDIDLKIFNRWGNLVFETTDRDINWDGKNKFSKGDCPDGVYYYTCTVNFFRLNGTESKQLHGYIHLIRGK